MKAWIGADGEGTTSAHAENTWTLTIASWPHWNYLRARGEYTNPVPLA